MAHEESARRERSRSRSRRREASPRSPRRRSAASRSRGRHSRSLSHSRSKTRSRSRSASASSSKDGRRRHHRRRRHRHADSRDKKTSRKHDESVGADIKDDGVEKKKRENREQVEHRSRMWTAVNSDDDEQASAKADEGRPSKSQDAGGKKEERRHRRRRHRSRSPSSSESESSSSGSDSNSSSEDDRKHRKHKHKKSSKRRKKETKKTKTQKTHKKDKKKRMSASGSSSYAVNQNEYGKYGILRESDFHAKSVSFLAWLREVKKMGEFNGPKWEAMELFQEYMEDYNTCTFPHEKYYDVEKYEMRRYAKQQRKALAKHQGAKGKALGALADEERVRRERREARERKEQEEFRLTLQMMDKDKIDAMRSQEHLRAQMQMHYKSGNVGEARRLEQMINKAEEDPRFKKR